MGWFRKKVKEPEPVNPALRDFTGQDIWTIVAHGLEANGMILRRNGTAIIRHDRFRDGKWHLTVEVDPKPDAVLDLVTENGDIVDITAWNAMTQTERTEFVINNGARFKVKDSVKTENVHD